MARTVLKNKTISKTEARQGGAKARKPPPKTPRGRKGNPTKNAPKSIGEALKKPSTASRVGAAVGKVGRGAVRGGAIGALATAGAMAAKTAYDYHKVTTGSQVTSPKPKVRALASHYEETYRAKNEGVIKQTVASRVKKEKARRRNAAP
jgi:hypothetical protein